MVVYVLIAVFLLVGGLSEQKQFVYKAGFLSLFILTAFRKPTIAGGDYYVYSTYFQSAPDLFHWVDMKNSYYEVGFRFLNSFVKLFSDKYLIFQIVYTCIVFLLMYLVIKSLCFADEQKCIFLFSFFCFHFIWDTWVILRQNIADWIYWLLIILIYKCPEKEKIKRYSLMLLAVSLPMLFHSTAKLNIILLPLMFLLGRISSKKRLMWVPIVSVILYLFGDSVYDFVLSVALPYMRWDMAKYGTTESNFINFLLRLTFFILFAWHYEFEEHPQKKMMLDTFTMMVLIGSFNNIVTTRLYEYYAIGLYASMALVLNSFEKRSKIIAYLAYGVAMIFILIRFVLTFDNGQAFLKYSLFF